MLDEPPPPRPARGQLLLDIGREDLELYSVEELQERVDRLRAEAARTEAQLERKRAGRAAADALFKR